MGFYTEEPATAAPMVGGTFYRLDIGAVLFVSLVSTCGRDGQKIEVLGQGFKGTRGVFFQGDAANFTVVSDHYPSLRLLACSAQG
jgi:hypothetical protein